MRKSLFVAAALCLALGATAFIPSLALAADGQTYQINLGPLVELTLPLLEALLMAVVTVVTGWLSRKASQYLGVQIEARHREALNEVIQSRLKQILVSASSARSPTYYTRQAVLAAVANYVIEKAPDAVKYFGLDEEGVRAMVLGRLTDAINKLTGDDDGNLASAAYSVPDGFAAAPLDLSRAVAGYGAPQAAGG
ncbi:hypothetical protein [uncultured Cohaesibacter sp.]|uniref:hypothetical protein n=1 Tax=uncultured Cohaesibacter sp. TaxID=1002546 RepID=UPI0029C61ADB|nr:hypothetical protein [uncultured Cohaesibacter sp.]